LTDPWRDYHYDFMDEEEWMKESDKLKGYEIDEDEYPYGDVLKEEKL
jgi:hypothetical protein